MRERTRSRRPRAVRTPLWPARRSGAVEFDLGQLQVALRHVHVLRAQPLVADLFGDRQAFVGAGAIARDAFVEIGHGLINVNIGTLSVRRLTLPAAKGRFGRRFAQKRKITFSLFTSEAIHNVAVLCKIYDMDTGGEPAKSTDCAACGGKLRLLAEIPPRDDAHPHDGRRIAYFRCERCAQIKIVER